MEQCIRFRTTWMEQSATLRAMQYGEANRGNPTVITVRNRQQRHQADTRVESRSSDVACRPGIFFFLNNVFPHELWNNSLHESSFIAIISFTLEIYFLKENRHLFQLKKKEKKGKIIFIIQLGENTLEREYFKRILNNKKSISFYSFYSKYLLEREIRFFQSLETGEICPIGGIKPDGHLKQCKRVTFSESIVRKVSGNFPSFLLHLRHGSSFRR